MVVVYDRVSADVSKAVGFRLPVQISLSPWSDGQSGRLVQSSEVLSLLPLSAAGCGGYQGVGSALSVSSRSWLIRGTESSKWGGL